MATETRDSGLRYAELAALRMRDLKYSERALSAAAGKYSRNAACVKVLLIVLGALVATKGVADNLRVDLQAYHIQPMAVSLTYTLIGAAIAIAAGIDSFFEFSKKASALTLLASEAQSQTRRFMSAVEIATASDNNKEGRRIVEEMNGTLERISKDAALHGVNLASDNPVDYASGSSLDGHSAA